MKRYNLLYGILVVWLTLYVGCDKYNDLDGYTSSKDVVLGLNVSTNEFKFNSGDENPKIPSQVLQIFSNTEWEIINDQEKDHWLSIEPKKGNGNCDVTLTSNVNTTHKDRNANIIVKYLDQEEVISVIQLSDRYIDISNNRNPLSIKFDEETKLFKIKSNVKWKIKIEDDTWCRIESTEGEDSKDIVLYCDSNKTGAPRNNKIIAYYGDLNVTKIIDTLEIVQEPNYVLIAEDDYQKRRTSIEFEYEGGTEDFVINSNVSWKITLHSKWIDFIKISDFKTNGYKQIPCEDDLYTWVGEGCVRVFIHAKPYDIDNTGSNRSEDEIKIDCTDRSKGVHCPPITLSQKPYK